MTPPTPERQPLGVGEVRRLMTAIDGLEKSARIRDGSGYGHPSVTAVVNVLREAESLPAIADALEERERLERELTQPGLRLVNTQPWLERQAPLIAGIRRAAREAEEVRE